ncbi:MAG: hypothetical protein ACLU4J_00230 [Butyricimonas paravirosa]
MLPLIRLPEMYYIIAECETDKESSAEALNTVMWARGISYEDGVVADDAKTIGWIRDPITISSTRNELMNLWKNTERILFWKRQLFYFYKRHNYRTFPYCVKENMAGFYQWPLPTTKIILAITIKFDKDEKI